MTLLLPPVAPEPDTSSPTHRQARELRRLAAPVREQPEPATAASPAAAAQPHRLAVSRQRRLKQGGRSVILWSLVLYVAAQLSVGFFTRRWQPIQVVNYDWKWQRLLKQAAKEPERPLVLMLGSSRVSWAFRPNRTNGMQGPDGQPVLAFNFGIPGAGPIHSKLFLQEMLQVGIRPRLLLLEYLPPLLCRPDRGITSEESMTEAAWTKGAELLELTPYFSSPNRKIAEWCQSQLAPWYAYRMDVHGEMQQLLRGIPPLPPPPVDEWGWRILDENPTAPANKVSYSARSFCMYAKGLARFRLGSGPVRALHDLLDLCRRERLPVALVVMPESSKFRKLYCPEANAAAVSVLAEVKDRFAVAVIDARCWLSDEDFEDGHHVNLGGAEQFTNRLNEHIQRLLAATD